MNQAQRIIEKLGGVNVVAKHTGRSRVAVYKWTYAKDNGGTGGLVPSSAVPVVKAAAKALGVRLSAEDWAP